MSDDGSTPGLAVGFLIEANYDELLRIQQIMGSTEMQIVREAANIERATKGMISPGATMQISAFGTAATKELRTIARETKAAEKAGEAMVSKLERENATFGKSRLELRHMRSEERALAAERVGNTDLAKRLRQQESQLWAKKYEVIRQAGIARKNAAEEAAEAEIRAQRAVMSQLRERAQLEDALYRNAGVGRLAATDGGAGFSALAARAAKELADAKVIESSAVREAAQAHGMFEAAVQRGTQAMREQEVLSKAADQLRASLDPAVAAQQRFNQEMEQAQHLISRGAISLDDYVAKLHMEQSALDGLQGALARGSKSAGAHRQAMTGVSYQIQDVMTQISMGQNPINALAVNGAQLAGQFANIEGKAGALARFFMGPWGLAITGAVMAVGMLTKGLFDNSKEMKEKEKAAKDLVKQMEQLYDANMRVIKSEQRLQQELVNSSKRLWEDAEATRINTLEKLKNAKAQLMQLQQQSRLETGVSAGEFGGAALAGTSLMRAKTALEIKELDAMLLANSEVVKSTGESYRAAKIPVMLSEIRAETDKAYAATVRFNKEMDAIKTLAVDGNINDDEAKRRFRIRSLAHDAEQKAIEEAEKADRKGLTSAERRAASIARESVSLQQKIASLFDLAKAYGISDEAALKVEATGRAYEKAIRKQADLSKFVADELRRTAAERVAQTAKTTADLNYQSQVQEQVNQSIRVGTLDISRMSDAVNDLMARREAAAALKIANNDGDPALIAAAIKAWNELTLAQQRSNQVREATLDLQQSSAITREIEEMQKLGRISAQTAEARQQVLLSGAGGFDQEMQLARINAQHEKQLILMRAQIAAEDARRKGLYETAIAIMDKMRVDREAIDKDLGFQTAEEAINRLKDAAAELDFASIFGRGGDAIRDMIGAMDGLRDAQLSHKVLLEEAGGDQAKIARADQLYQNAKVASTMKQIGAVKSLFKENSAGYQAMAAAEKAYAMVQLANTAVNVAAGAAKMFASLGPWAFPVVAAMVGVVAALGFRGGGGGSMVAPPSSEELQAQFATGTVFGDSSAQSASIAKSLEIMSANSNADLEFANSSLQVLRQINGGISDLAGKLGQQIGISSGGMFDTSRLNIGSSGKGGVFGIGGSSTTRDLYDQGLRIYTQTIDQILAGQFNARVYNVVQQIKKKKGVFGIGGGTSTSYFTSYGAIDPSIRTAFSDIIGNVTDGVVAITATYSQAMADDLRVMIGRMSLPGLNFSTKGMSLSDIESALQGYFSNVADQVAMQAANQMPVLRELQRAGEGMFETLTRVIKNFSSINIGLSSIGMAGFGQGDAGLRGTSELTDLFGDLDAYQDAIGKFGDKFLSQAEKMQPIIDAVRNEMDRLGMAGINTNDQFKDLVRGLDLSSDAGRLMFASLMAVAPAFAKITDYMGALDGTIGESAEIMKKRISLEIQIMELQGRTAEALAAKRQQEINELDASLRPLQLYIYALQDEATAKANLKTAYERESKEITSLRDKFVDLGKTLREYRGTLAVDANPADAYRKAAMEFGIAADASRLGDADAMQKLSQLGQAFLGQSLGNASSQIDYLRDIARVTQAVDDAIGAAGEAVDYQQAQLDALDAIVRGHIDLNQNVLSIVDAVRAVEAAQLGIVGLGADVGEIPPIATSPATSQSEENAALRAEIASLSEKLDRVVNATERGANAGERSNSHGWQRIVDNDAIRVRDAD